MITRLAAAAVELPFRLRDWFAIRRLHERCQAGDKVTFTAQTKIHNPFATEAVRIGAGSLFMGEVNVITAEARVSLGEWCFVGPGAKLWARDGIAIGDRVFISHGVQVFDNNSHSLSAAERHERFRELQTTGRHSTPERVTSRRIVIGDDVWIGFNAAIMKGVTVGRGAVVGAGAMVTHDVADYAIVVGNPARQVGEAQR